MHHDDAGKGRETFPNPAMRQGKGQAVLSNPQLMAQDVQVKQYDLSGRQRAVENITAKQSVVSY